MTLQELKAQTESELGLEVREIGDAGKMFSVMTPTGLPFVTLVAVPTVRGGWIWAKPTTQCWDHRSPRLTR